MNRLFALAALGGLLLAGCQQPAPEAAPETDAPDGVEMVADLSVVVGEDPGDGAVLFAADAAAQAEELAGQPVRVAGVVDEVCQMAGCWLTFRDAGPTPIRVKIPRGDDGYAFAFPKDIAGRSALVSGTLAVEETDVEMLRHFAEDRGASAEEIAAITEPRRTIVLTATGARLEAAPAPAAENA